MNRLIRFFKNWTLPISMTTGGVGYLLYAQLPLSVETKVLVNHSINFLQPLLIFSMLFLTFCNVNLKELRPVRWHLWLILIQIGVFAFLGMPLLIFPDTPLRVILEGAMICMITPTATASAVVTQKLGGNTQSLTTYIILINLASAVAIPIVLPMVHPNPEMTFLPSFLLILRKVFPLLISPLALSWLVRTYFKSLHRQIVKWNELPFYIWSVALAIAIAVTVRSMVHSEVNPWLELGIAVVAALLCVSQFVIGKVIGSRYDDRISAGQSLGQKNTVFTIWLGATFLSPVTSLAGGFYSVCHNLFNAYQLYKKRKT